MVKAGVIRPSNSQWAAATILPPKKDDEGNYSTFRVVHDYRPINAVTDQDAYNVPSMDELLSEVAGHKWYSAFDIRGAYNTLPVAEADMHKTAFWCGDQLFEYCCAPMGLKNAGIQWQRCIDTILQNIPGVKCYADDIVIYGDGTLEEHLQTVKIIFDRMEEYGIKLAAGKVQLACSHITYLGHIVTSDGLAPQPQKVEAIIALSCPNNISSLRSFLGMVNYYAHFITNLHEVKKPLTLLLRKSTKWVWGTSQHDAFELLKQRLISAPVLRAPNWNRPFTLYTDWSRIGCGFILAQKDDDNLEYVVEYGSSTNNNAEANYSSYEGELLAVKKGIEHYRYYLFGRKFQIVTDHQPLHWLLTTPSLRGKFARWAVILSEYDFEIVHRAGKAHKNVDALSRLRVATDITTTMQQSVGMWAAHKAISAGLVALHSLVTPTKDIWQSPDLLSKVQSFMGIDGSTGLFPVGLRSYRWDGTKLWKVLPSGAKLHVPEPSERSNIILQTHERLGHLGRDRTYDILSQNYWWAGMHSDTHKVVSMCRECDRAKNSSAHRSPALQPLPIKPPFYRVSLDIAGPLPASVSRFTAVLIIVEHFTKHVELVPLRKVNAATVADAFQDRILFRFGAPAECLTDGGSEFKREFHMVCQKYNIEHRVISPDHPSANGAAERVVQILKAALRAYVLREGRKKWDDYVPHIQFGYNITPQKSTGFSPYYLLYGRQPLFPEQLRATYADHLDVEDEAQVIDFIEHRAIALAHAIPTAMENLVAAQQRDVKRYRHRRSGIYKAQPYQFSVGDFVYYRQPAENTLDVKTARHILRVKEMRPSDIVILEGSDGNTKAVHVSNCQPCRLPQIMAPDGYQDPHMACTYCGGTDPNEPSSMIICDFCEQGSHISCLPEPLNVVPDGRWICIGCRAYLKVPAFLHVQNVIFAPGYGRGQVGLGALALGGRRAAWHSGKWQTDRRPLAPQACHHWAHGNK
jgi:hypothetical protein